MKIGLAQINPVVGDLAGNSARLLAAYHALTAQGAELVVAPELALPGGPLLDLAFRSSYVKAAAEALATLQASLGAAPLVVGTIEAGPTGALYNVAAVLERGLPLRTVAKRPLNDGDIAFDSRYFHPAESGSPCVIELLGRQIAITIGENLWAEPAAPPPSIDGATLLLNLAASPFIHQRPEHRAAALSRHAAALGIPLLSCHSIGGNDSLIYDGTSLAYDAQGQLLSQLPSFQESSTLIELPPGGITPSPIPFRAMERYDAILEALTLGLRDYIHKSGFKTALLGLSGGLDSALAAAIAVRAIGAENVLGITMPTQHSSEGSIHDSVALARNLGIRCIEIPIRPAYDTLSTMLAPHFGEPSDTDTTEENLQPRLRGMILMAFSNKFGHLVLTTGNKSELAVGYCTLYGDMAGGIAPLADLWKTEAYALAHHINRERELIPRSTLEKPPSAELRPGQVDQDTLPPYDLLDAILALFIEEERSIEEIIALGYDAETVRSIVQRVEFNEYKRAQAAIGLKLSKRAFGIGRRLPLVRRIATTS